MAVLPSCAIPGAMLAEAAPDFVGLTDVAELTGMSRQNMRKTLARHLRQFTDGGWQRIGAALA
jgi:hypothetical protein